MGSNIKLKDINKRISLMAEKEFTGRKIVFGDGNVNSKILLIGEAPGANEEKEGRPFVGKAGKNLTEFMESIKIDRSELYITNVVKIRPYRISPKTGRAINRAPDNKEKALFTPFLYEEIEAVNPEIVVTLGNVPLQAVLNDKSVSIGEYHGKLINFMGKKIFQLYHPAAVIYNSSLKKIYTNDLKELREYVKRMGVDINE